MISWLHYWKVGIIHDCYFCCCYYYTTVIRIHILQEDLQADLEVWKQDPFWGFPCFLILPNVCLMTFKGCFSRRCFWHESWGINSTLRSLSPSLDQAKLGRGGNLNCTGAQRWLRSGWWVWSHSQGLPVTSEDMDYMTFSWIWSSRSVWCPLSIRTN